jgi:hypothetical protein
MIFIWVECGNLKERKKNSKVHYALEIFSRPQNFAEDSGEQAGSYGENKFVNEEDDFREKLQKFAQ